MNCPAIFVFDFGSGSLEEMKQAFSCLAAVFRTPNFMTNGAKSTPNVIVGLNISATLTARHPKQDFVSSEESCKSGWIESGSSCPR
jgi:hypothetical protein